MSQDNHYNDSIIQFLEKIWGEGFMSPGGPEEVARIVDGLDLAGKTLIDIGCGSGGIAVALAKNHGVGKVIGLDVEADACGAARVRATREGLSERIEIRLIEPGPLPLEDDSVDFVFSKDSIVHIEDKEFLGREAFRVLRSGGWFAASDWLISHDGEPSPEMKTYIAAEDLDFAMASPARYEAALKAAGFEDVQLVNRNPWYREVARAELARLTGPERPDFEAIVGPEEMERQINTWTVMQVPLGTGEHCPHHLRGRKP